MFIISTRFIFAGTVVPFQEFFKLHRHSSLQFLQSTLVKFYSSVLLQVNFVYCLPQCQIPRNSLAAAFVWTKKKHPWSLGIKLGHSITTWCFQSFFFLFSFFERELLVGSSNVRTQKLETWCCSSFTSFISSQETTKKLPFPSTHFFWGKVLTRPSSWHICLRINNSQIILGRPDIWSAITRPQSHA